MVATVRLKGHCLVHVSFDIIINIRLWVFGMHCSRQYPDLLDITLETTMVSFSVLHCRQSETRDEEDGSEHPLLVVGLKIVHSLTVQVAIF